MSSAFLPFWVCTLNFKWSYGFAPPTVSSSPLYKYLASLLPLLSSKQSFARPTTRLLHSPLSRRRRRQLSDSVPHCRPVRTRCSPGWSHRRPRAPGRHRTNCQAHGPPHSVASAPTSNTAATWTEWERRETSTHQPRNSKLHLYLNVPLPFLMQLCQQLPRKAVPKRSNATKINLAIHCSMCSCGELH